MSDRSLAVQWAARGWSTKRIVALYALIGGAWILLSDRLFIFNAPDQNTAAVLSTVKGLGYVVATALLLYWLINRYTAELRASEERFRIIFEHANDAIHIDTADDTILDVNPRMCELMGYSRDELLTMRIPDLQAPELRATGCVVAVEQAQHGDTLFESLNLHRNGQRIPVEISVARVARPQGDLYVSVIRDITERKRAEEALRAREALLRAVVDNIPFEFWARDPEGRCFMENVALVKHWGSLLGTRVEESAAAPEDVAHWQANNARALAGEMVDEEVYYVTHGDRRQFRNIVASIRVGDEIRGILGLNIDITDRKRAEEELRQSQAFNQALIDHSPLGISVRNRTGKLLFANMAWRNIWAIPEVDLQDDTTRERAELQFTTRDDYLKPYQADLRRVYEQGGYLHLPELKTTHPRPGAAEWVSQHFYAIVDEQGQVDRVVILTEDISDRRRTEIALRESEEQFRSLVEQSPLSTQVLSPEGRTLQVNHAFETLWGLTLDDLKDYNILADQQLVRLGLMPYIQRGFSGEAASISAAEYDSQESVGVGEKKWVQARIYPVKDEAGNIRQVILIHENITGRKRAEEALLESEARLRQIASTVHEVFWLRDTQTLEMLYVNPAYETVWGRTCASLYTNPTSFLDAVHPDDKDRIMKAIAVQRETGTSFNEEYRIVRPDNSLRWVWGQTFPIKNEAGQVYRIAASVMDVTERRQAEEALRDSEAKFRAVVENSHDGILFSDANATILYRSPSYQRLNGYTDEERVGHAGFDTVHPDDLDRVRQYWAEILQHPAAVHNTEYRILHKDGRWRWIETSGQNLLGNPHVQAVVVTSRDITDRKQHEREIAAIAAIATALRTAATRNEMIPVIVGQIHSLLKADGAALIKHEPATGEAIIIYGQGVDTDSIGLRIPPGEGIVGHVISTRQPYLSQDVEHDPHVFRPDLSRELRALVCAPLIAHEQIIGAVWAGRRTAFADEELRLLAAIGDIAANALHRAEVLETLEQRVYDRTRELAAANERLQELDRLKSKFVSDVSHELRTPITSLMLNVELLEHGKPEKREHYLSVIRQQTARQVQLIEDILNLSRLELSTTRTQFAPVNVNALIEQAITVYRSSAEAANLSLTFTPAATQPVVMGVESHLSQVVTNLIANAINYTPTGSVEVSTRLADHEVVIEVRDTGLGIAPEDMPHLFNRFYRGKLTWQVRGSGLGLAIVKEITEVHKGRVEVDSQAGVGSTFRVYLPVV